MDDETRQRIERLEEHHSFSAHHTDQLDEQVRAAFERLERLTARLDRLENRMLTLEDAGDLAQQREEAAAEDPDIEFERPPHSSRARPGE